MTEQKIKTAAEIRQQLNGAKQAQPAAPVDFYDDKNYEANVQFIMEGVHSNILGNKIPMELATPALIALAANYAAGSQVKVNAAVDDFRRQLVHARNLLLQQKAAAMKAAQAAKDEIDAKG